MEDIEITFPGGKRVDAKVGPYVVHTDQPVESGGEGAAVAPFDLFLASLGACAGLYVLAFCQTRGISTDGLSLRERVEVNPATKLPSGIRIEVRLPSSFPDKYRTAVLRAAEGCKVKKTIAAAPSVDVALAPGDEPLVKAS